MVSSPLLGLAVCLLALALLPCQAALFPFVAAHTLPVPSFKLCSGAATGGECSQRAASVRLTPLAHTPRTVHAATRAAGEVESNQEWCWLVNVSEDGKTLNKHVQRSVDSQSSEAGKYTQLSASVVFLVALELVPRCQWLVCWAAAISQRHAPAGLVGCADATAPPASPAGCNDSILPAPLETTCAAGGYNTDCPGRLHGGAVMFPVSHPLH